MINNGLFTSLTCEWNTPEWLMEYLRNQFGEFDLDPCTTYENRKAENWYQYDGLQLKWYGKVFCNPPYGKVIGLWIKKAYESVENYDADLVVMLLPARTDTKWFHDYCLKGKIQFIKGRLKFKDQYGNYGGPAPFPSMLVTFRNSINEYWDTKALNTPCCHRVIVDGLHSKNCALSNIT